LDGQQLDLHSGSLAWSSSMFLLRTGHPPPHGPPLDHTHTQIFCCTWPEAMTPYARRSRRARARLRCCTGG
jgi:hypothetical protein